MSTESPVHPGSFEIEARFPADASSVRDARRRLAAWLGALETDTEAAGDLVLATSEMAGNAVRAGSTWFRLRAWMEGAVVAVEVSDDGPGFEAPDRASGLMPDFDAEGGRGLFLVRSLVDRCTITSDACGTTVLCRKRVSRPS